MGRSLNLVIPSNPKWPSNPVLDCFGKTPNVSSSNFLVFCKHVGEKETKGEPMLSRYTQICMTPMTSRTSSAWLLLLQSWSGDLNLKTVQRSMERAYANRKEMKTMKMKEAQKGRFCPRRQQVRNSRRLMCIILLVLGLRVGYKFDVGRHPHVHLWSCKELQVPKLLNPKLNAAVLPSRQIATAV